MKQGPLRVSLLLTVLVCPGLAHADWWLGPASANGPIAQPAGYLQAQAGLTVEKFDFNDLQVGQRIEHLDDGHLGLFTYPTQLVITAQSGSVAGAQPTSLPLAAFVPQDITRPGRVILLFSSPVQTVGFALMGMKSPATVGTYDSDGALLESISVSPQTGLRQWIGVSAGDTLIQQVRITPSLSGTYGLDDVELGYHHMPEPGTILLASMLCAALCRRGSRQGHQRGC